MLYTTLKRDCLVVRSATKILVEIITRIKRVAPTRIELNVKAFQSKVKQKFSFSSYHEIEMEVNTSFVSSNLFLTSVVLWRRMSTQVLTDIPIRRMTAATNKTPTKIADVSSVFVDVVTMSSSSLFSSVKFNGTRNVVVDNTLVSCNFSIIDIESKLGSKSSGSRQLKFGSAFFPSTLTSGFLSMQ